MVQPHLQAMNEQINNMDEAFTRFRDLYLEFTDQSEENSVTETESEITRLRNTAKWLAHQNKELQDQVNSHKPELERTIDGREAAFRKLENAYRVIRDLINEVERLQVANGLQPSRTDEPEWTRQVIRDALAQSSSSGSSSESNRTVRQHSSPLRRGVPQQGAPKQVGAPHEHRHSPTEAQSKTSSSSSGHLPSPEASGNESASDSEHSSVSSFANVNNDERWSIHYGDKPPGVCNMSFGPVTYERLLRYSMITIEHVKKLKELEDAEDLCLRLHSTSNLIFLNDPIFLEERAENVKKTYILDWGIAEENAVLTKFIRSRGGVVLHTFVFPEKKKKWFYVGGFTWHVANQLHAIWPSLGRTSKKKILSKLCERSPDYDETEVAAKLDDGRLSQICLEISSDGLWKPSREFALRMGYQSRPHDKP